VELEQPLPTQVLVKIGEAGAITVDASERAAAPDEAVYRRVLDRSYRWVAPDR
jgi:hypothetical protein